MFKRECLELGPVPASEECQQVDGINTDYDKLIDECRRYKDQLETIFPDRLDHCCSFAIKRYPHDFGTYMEVVVYYFEPEEEDTDSLDFAFFVESNLPDTWEDKSIRNFDVYQSSEIARQFQEA